jgi:peptidoglycan/LPS O-acetylase OafA/YrhL
MAERTAASAASEPAQPRVGQALPEVVVRTCVPTATDTPEAAQELHDHHQRLGALTGIRAFAAVWVVLYHFQDEIFGLLPGLRVARPFLQAGYSGVDLFFVLSGFILAYNYLHRLGERPSASAYGSFLWVRLARIYPLHFVTLNAMAAIWVGARLANVAIYDSQSVSHTGTSYATNLTLTQAWWNDRLSWNDVAWSVSAEWLAYLVFPLLAIVLVNYRSRWLSWAGVALAYLVLEVTWRVVYWDQFGGALVRIGTEFLAGCFLFKVFECTRRSRTWSTVSIVASVAIIAATWLVDGPGYHAIVLAPLFGLLVLSLAFSSGPLAGILARRGPIFWGEASYALYLTHQIVGSVLHKVLPVDSFAGHTLLIRVGGLTIYISLIAGTAVAAYLLVERPARDRLRRIRFPTLQRLARTASLS